ncbi:hypothetical protein Q9966_016705, partial [Columba livia]
KPPPPEFPTTPEGGDELEDDAPRRKNKAKGKTCGLGAVRRRQEAALEDRDKPYVCDICGKRYKNRPGLSYHYTHTHLAEEEGDEHGGERLGPPRRNHHRATRRACSSRLHMAAAVRSYRWQCLECKSCSLCGTAENDDQLLFCDDCDRGFHMFCLSPPHGRAPRRQLELPPVSAAAQGQGGRLRHPHLGGAGGLDPPNPPTPPPAKSHRGAGGGGGGLHDGKAGGG